jgi:hypothetical protein
MKVLITAVLTTLAITGNALAQDGFKIESEAQFEQQYADQIEKIEPGVYLIVKGESAGNTVAIGRSGLTYDLSVHRARAIEASETGQPSGDAADRIRKLEAALARYSELDAHLENGTADRNIVSRAFSCISYQSKFPIWYSAAATLQATQQFYVDNGSGGWNYYFARSYAGASGTVLRPFNLPFSNSGLEVEVLAQNRQTGASVRKYTYATSGYSLNTGFVTNFNFTHSLYAEATAFGYGECFGYASVSDSDLPY